MTKKVSIILLAVFFIMVTFSQNSSVYASSSKDPIFIGVNDKLTNMNPTPVSYENTTYVPVRFFAQELGINLSYVGNIVTLDNSEHKMFIDLSKNMISYSNGTIEKVSIVNKENRIMLPYRVIAEYFGYKVSYISEGPVARVVNSHAKLDDAKFFEKFKATFEKSKHNKPVYLTFDDGPTNHTMELLDILDKYDAKATFFMLSGNITSYPNAVKRLYNEGNAVGLHSVTHEKSLFYKSPYSSLLEMNQTNESLYKVLKVKSSLIRTPYGSKPYFTQPYRDLVTQNGYHIWDWNVDSNDWRHKEDYMGTYNEVIRELRSVQKQGRAPIILMHDRKTTLKALPLVLEQLVKEGYDFEVISSTMTPQNFWKDVR